MNKEDYFKYYIQGSDHYLIPRDEFIEVLRKNEELKKQLEDANEKIILLQASKPMLEWKKGIREKSTKRVYEWLEDYLNLFDNMDIEEQASYDTIEEILQKYKSIIGVSNETS